MANPQSLRTGAKIVERGGFPIAASQMRSAADEIDQLRKEKNDLVNRAYPALDALDRLRAALAEKEYANDTLTVHTIEALIGDRTETPT